MIAASMWDKVAVTGCRFVLWACLGVVACRQDAPAPSGHKPPSKTETSKPAPAPAPARDALVADRPTRYPAAARIVAIGDVHGDLDATRTALRLAGAVDANDKWSGGELVVVQTGDQLDRGDEEQAILDLFARLETEADAAGGAVHVLNGNHEIMNAIGDLRYVTPNGFADFADVEGLPLEDPRLANAPALQRPRLAAFLPGGPYALMLARRNTAVIVGDNVFVHGGILPADAKRIDAINRDIRQWLAGKHSDARAVMDAIMAPDSIVWTRRYSASDRDDVCASLAQSLRIMKVARMVVGHTPQKTGITSACDGRVWRIDVGMAKHYGGTTQVLEIADGTVTILKV